MVNPDLIFGRLGNRMFQMAFLYSYAKDNGIDFYFQDPSFFQKYSTDIKLLYGSGIPSKTDMVAIHVRRGDYVGNKFYVNLFDTLYYQDAMREFDSKFIVFSDDIEWCKQQEIFKDCEFSEGKSELEDLNLMASCVGHIIANSSFSWWGAFISPYTKKVIAPKNWYTDNIERTKCPNNWIKL